VQAPRILPRVIRLPKELAPKGAVNFVFLTSILHEHVGELFTGRATTGCYQFRVTRNSDLFVEEEDVKDLRIALQGELPQRHFGDAVRLEVAHDCPAPMVEFLLEQFQLGPEDLYQVNGPVNLVRLMQVPSQIDREDLLFRRSCRGSPSRCARAQEGARHLRSNARRGHPPASPVPELRAGGRVRRASGNRPERGRDQQTVYRTGTDSVLMEALIEAATNGKEVTAVVELKARFDEEANINWAARLEEVGAHVVYGVVGHKNACEGAAGGAPGGREAQALRPPVDRQLSPAHGAPLHRLRLFTADEAITAEVADVFVQLTSLGKASKLKHLWQAPFTLHTHVVDAIRNETRIAKAGRKARIIAKMNALLEPEVIDALYAASQAGVEIDLIVRGVCGCAGHPRPL